MSYKMNYPTQLNGFAMEMAIKAKHAGMTMDEVISATKSLVEFTYNPEKAFESHFEDLIKMLREAPSDAIDIPSIILVLERIKLDRIQQGIDTDPDKVIEFKEAAN